MSDRFEEQVRGMNSSVGQLLGQGRLDEALRIAQQACDLAKQHLPSDNPTYGVSLSNLGMAYRFRGEYDKALPPFQEAVRILRAAWGPAHRLFPHVLENLSQVYEATGNYAAAEPQLREVVDIVRGVVGERHLEFATALTNLAALYRRMGKHVEAIRLARQTIDIRRVLLSEEHPEFASSLNNLAMLHKDLREYKEAEALYKRALEIFRRTLGPNHPEYAITLNNLGELYQAMGRYSEAKTYFQKAVEVFRGTVGPQHPKTITCLRNLANLYGEMSDYNAAEPLLYQILQECRDTVGENHPDFAAAASDLGLLFTEMGRYEEAEPLLRQAVEVARASVGENHERCAIGLNNLAMLCRYLGKYDEAEAMYRRVLETRRSVLGHDHRDLAPVLNGLGGLYRAMGDYRSAEGMYRQALQIHERLSEVDHPDYGRCLNNLGGLYEDMANLEKAQSCYFRALDIWQRALGRANPLVASVLNNLTGVLLLVGLHAEAEESCRRATEIWRVAVGEDSPQYAIGLNNLAGMLAARGSHEEALRLAEKSLEIRRAAFGENHPEVANGLYNLAGLYTESGRFADAERLLRQSLAICRSTLGDHHPHVAWILIGLATVCLATDQAAEALNLMKQVAVIGDQMLGQVFSFSTERERTDYLLVTRAQFYPCLSLVLDHFVTSQSAANWAFDLLLRRKGVILESLATQRDAVLVGRDPEVQKRLGEFRELQMQIARETMSGPRATERKAYRERLDELRVRRDKLEAELVRHIPEMNMEQLASVDSERVAAALPSESVLVEFFRFSGFDFGSKPSEQDGRAKPPRYLAFVLPAGQPQRVQMIDIGDAEVIDRMIYEFRRAITGEVGGGQRRDLATAPEIPAGSSPSASVELTQAVFRPLVGAFQGRTRLLIAPDGELATVPFEALPAKKDGSRLIDEYSISYLATARDFLGLQSPSRAGLSSPMVIADPDFDLCLKGVVPHRVSTSEDPTRSRDLTRADLHFSRLEGTRIEAARISEMLGVTPVLDAAALKSLVRQLRFPQVLHLATHGFFLRDQEEDHDPCSPIRALRFPSGLAGSESRRFAASNLENPLLRSGLAMAGANTWLAQLEPPAAAEDGLLTAEDVTGIDLLGTELVVLSACETGLGEVHVGEGVFGLRRAFALAGVRTLVMSLWKVPDEQTQELMVDFYRRLLAGDGRADALRHAQLAMKEKYPDPFYWAAFICQGDPGPLRFGG